MDPKDKELREHLAQVDAEDREEAAWQDLRRGLIEKLRSGRPLIAHRKVKLSANDVMIRLLNEDEGDELYSDLERLLFLSAKDNTGAGAEAEDLVKRICEQLVDDHKDAFIKSYGEPDDVDFFEYREAI